jgi:hypothetical protein
VSRSVAALVALVALSACMPSDSLPPVATSTVEAPSPAPTSPSPVLPSLVLPSISLPPLPTLPPTLSPSPTGDYRTLVGRVEDADPCPALLVGTERWALTGDMARTLVDGARVEVRGPQITAPRGCGDGRALEVVQARPR